MSVYIRLAFSKHPLTGIVDGQWDTGLVADEGIAGLYVGC
jgi:hypothetical protein